MPMPNNEPGGLYLHLGTENSEPYEVECDYKTDDCGYDIDLHCVKGVMQAVDDPLYWAKSVNKPCPVCKGTGKRRVRVTGKVAVAFDEFEEIGSASSYSLDAKRTDISSGWHYFSEDFREQQKALISTLVTRFRNNTLPASVRDGLHEEDCDEAM